MFLQIMYKNYFSFDTDKKVQFDLKFNENNTHFPYKLDKILIS